MELKVYKMVDEKYCTDCVCVIPSEVYLKSEADKVIAEKDKAISELKADIADLRDDKKSTDAILDECNAEVAKLQAIIEERDETISSLRYEIVNLERRVYAANRDARRTRY